MYPIVVIAMSLVGGWHCGAAPPTAIAGAARGRLGRCGCLRFAQPRRCQDALEAPGALLEPRAPVEGFEGLVFVVVKHPPSLTAGNAHIEVAAHD